MPAGAVFEHSSTSTRGAALLTRYRVWSEDATAELAYIRYIKKNYKSWLYFAQSKDRNVAMHELILVTGHDITHNYAMAAFTDNSVALRISFQVGSANSSSSISAWGTWQTSPAVYQNCGPLSSRTSAPCV